MTKKLFMLLRLEMKRSLQSLPLFFIGAIVLSILIGTIAFCSEKILYSNENLSQITIALVVSDDSQIMDWALSFVSDMDSTKGTFHFDVTTKEEGYEKLNQGLVAALMIIPDQTLNHILDGTNQSVQVVFPDQKGLSSLLLQELTSAGAKTLGSAQASIYTVSDLYIANHLDDYLKETYKQINLMNMEYALSRNRLFHQISATSTGTHSTFTYYFGSAFVLFLLLWGITCSHFLGGEVKAFHQKLKAEGIFSFSYQFIKLLTIFITFIISIFILMIPISLFLHFALHISMIKYFFLWFHLTSFFSFLLVVLCISAYILFVFQLSSSSTSILLLFISSIILLFLSGGFIPLAFFPTSIRHFAPFLPTTYLMNQMSNLANFSYTSDNNIAIGIYTLVFYILSSITYDWRHKG